MLSIVKKTTSVEVSEFIISDWILLYNSLSNLEVEIIFNHDVSQILSNKSVEISLMDISDVAKYTQIINIGDLTTRNHTIPNGGLDGDYTEDLDILVNNNTIKFTTTLTTPGEYYISFRFTDDSYIEISDKKTILDIGAFYLTNETEIKYNMSYTNSSIDGFYFTGTEDIKLGILLGSLVSYDNKFSGDRKKTDLIDFYYTQSFNTLFTYPNQLNDITVYDINNTNGIELPLKIGSYETTKEYLTIQTSTSNKNFEDIDRSRDNSTDTITIDIPLYKNTTIEISSISLSVDSSEFDMGLNSSVNNGNNFDIDVYYTSNYENELTTDMAIVFDDGNSITRSITFPENILPPLPPDPPIV
jgi:hypothetical protein